MAKRQGMAPEPNTTASSATTARPPFDPSAHAHASDEECLAALRAAEPARTESAARLQTTSTPPSGTFRRQPSSPALLSGEDVPYLLLSRADLE
jgi:hypothetical protein